MKKATFSVGLFLCVLTFLNGSQAHAATADEVPPPNKSSRLNAFEYGAVAAATIKKPEAKKDKEPAEKPAAAPVEKAPVQHIVAPGESLTMIAGKHASTWMRLFAKNTQVANPDIIIVGEKITIPDANEQLPERPLPAPPPPQPVAATTQPANPANGSYVPTYGSPNSAGNTYSAGYCTWYAKNRRPDLPNNLGNADTWVYRAQAQGLATGSAPRAGAIGQQGMHVVYVESVNGDGTVTISEMNYEGLYVTSSRTVAAGNFMYIY